MINVGATYTCENPNNLEGYRMIHRPIMASNIRSAIIRLALVLPLVGAALLMYPQPGYASKCAVPGTPSVELARSAAVFEGEVISVRRADESGVVDATTGPTTIGFEVRTVWKGPTDPTMELTTSPSRESCGYPFVEGATYIVYAATGSSVSACSRTLPLSEAVQDLSELGEGQVVTPDAGRPQPGCLGPKQAPDADWPRIRLICRFWN